MRNFLTLAEAQYGSSVDFKFTTRTGKEWSISVSACRTQNVLDVSFRKDGKYIGSITIDNDGKRTIWGTCSLMDKKMVQLIVEETDREDSCIAPAWKQACIDLKRRRLEKAQMELEACESLLENI